MMAYLTEDERWLEAQPRTLAEKMAQRDQQIAALDPNLLNPEIANTTPGLPDLSALGVQGDIAVDGSQAQLPANVLSMIEDQVDGPLDQSLKNLILAHHAVFGDWPDFSLTADLMTNGEVKFDTYEEALQFFEIVKASYGGTGQEWKLDASRSTGEGMPVMGAEKKLTQNPKYSAETDVLDPEMIASFRPKKVEDFLFGPYMKSTQNGKTKMWREGRLRLDEMLIAIPKQWAISQLSDSVGRSSRYNNPDLAEDEALMIELNKFVASRMPGNAPKPEPTAQWQVATEDGLRLLQQMRASALYVASAEGGEASGPAALEAASFLENEGYSNILNVLDQQIRQAAMPSGSTPEAQRKALDAHAAWVEQMYVTSRNPGITQRMALHELHDLNPNATTLSTQQLVGSDNMKAHFGMLFGWVGDIPGTEEAWNSAAFKGVRSFVPAVVGEIGDVFELPVLKQAKETALWSLESIGKVYEYRNLALATAHQYEQDMGWDFYENPESIPASEARKMAFAEYLTMENKDHPNAEKTGNFVERWKFYWHNNQDAKNAGIPMQYTDEMMRDTGMNPAAHPEASFAIGFAFDTVLDLALFKGAGLGLAAVRGTATAVSAAEKARGMLNIYTMAQVAESTAERTITGGAKGLGSGINLAKPKGAGLYDLKSFTANMNSIFGFKNEDLIDLGKLIAKGELADGTPATTGQIIRAQVPTMTKTSKGHVNPDSWAIHERMKEKMLYEQTSALYRGKHPIATYMLEKTYALRKFSLRHLEAESSAQRIASQYRTTVFKEKNGFALTVKRELDQARLKRANHPDIAILEDIERSGDGNRLADFIAGRYLHAQDDALIGLKKDFEVNKKLRYNKAVEDGVSSNVLQDILAEEFETFGKRAFERAQQKRISELPPMGAAKERAAIEAEDFIPDLTDLNINTSKVRSLIAKQVDHLNTEINAMEPASPRFQKWMDKPKNLKAKEAWLRWMEQRNVKDLEGNTLIHIPREAERRAWTERQVPPDERLPVGVKGAADLAKESKDMMQEIAGSNHRPDAVMLPSQVGARQEETSKVFRWDMHDAAVKRYENELRIVDEARQRAGQLTLSEEAQAERELSVALHGVELAKKNLRLPTETLREYDTRIFNLSVDVLEKRAQAIASEQAKEDAAKLVGRARKVKRNRDKLASKLEKHYQDQVSSRYAEVREQYMGAEAELNRLNEQIALLEDALPVTGEKTMPSIMHYNPRPVDPEGPMQARRAPRHLDSERRAAMVRKTELQELLKEKIDGLPTRLPSQVDEWARDAETEVLKSERALRDRLAPLGELGDMDPQEMAQKVFDDFEGTIGKLGLPLDAQETLTFNLITELRRSEAARAHHEAMRLMRVRTEALHGQQPKLAKTRPRVQIHYTGEDITDSPMWLENGFLVGEGDLQLPESLLKLLEQNADSTENSPLDLIASYLNQKLLHRYEPVKDLDTEWKFEYHAKDQPTDPNEEWLMRETRGHLPPRDYQGYAPELESLKAERKRLTVSTSGTRQGPRTMSKEERKRYNELANESVNIQARRGERIERWVDEEGNRQERRVDEPLSFEDRKRLAEIEAEADALDKQTFKVTSRGAGSNADALRLVEINSEIERLENAIKFGRSTDNLWTAEERAAHFQEQLGNRKALFEEVEPDEQLRQAIIRIMDRAWEAHAEGRPFELAVPGQKITRDMAAKPPLIFPAKKTDVRFPMLLARDTLPTKVIGQSKYTLQRDAKGKWNIIHNEPGARMAVRNPLVVSTVHGRNPLASPFRVRQDPKSGMWDVVNLKTKQKVPLEAPVLPAKPLSAARLEKIDVRLKEIHKLLGPKPKKRGTTVDEAHRALLKEQNELQEAKLKNAELLKAQMEHPESLTPITTGPTLLSEQDARALADRVYLKHLRDLHHNKGSMPLVNNMVGEAKSLGGLVIEGEQKHVLLQFLEDYQQGMLKSVKQDGVEDWVWKDRVTAEGRVLYETATDMKQVYQGFWGEVIAKFIEQNIDMRAPVRVNTPESIAAFAERQAQRAAGGRGTTQRDLWQGETHRPQRIISGAQAGGDNGGLRAAAELGISHEAHAFEGFKPKTGSIPTSATRIDHPLTGDYSSKLRQRTEINVKQSDATIIFVDRPIEQTVGSKLTANYAKKHGKPFLVILAGDKESVAKIRTFLNDNRPETLNIAGTREANEAGVQKALTLAMQKQKMQARTPGKKEPIPARSTDDILEEMQDYDYAIQQWDERWSAPDEDFDDRSPEDMPSKSDVLERQQLVLKYSELKKEYDEVVASEKAKPRSYQDMTKEEEAAYWAETSGTLATPEDEAALANNTITPERLEEIATPPATPDIEKLRSEIYQNQIGQVNLERQRQMAYAEYMRLHDAKIVAEQNLRDAKARLDGGLVRNNAEALAKELESDRAFLKELQEEFGTTETDVTQLLIDLDAKIDHAQNMINKVNGDPVGFKELHPLDLQTEAAMEWQLEQWHYSAFNYSKLAKFRAGGAIKAVEKFNSYKVPGIGWSIDDATTLYKTIIMAKVSTMLRIPLADEATRFITEGINPLEAWKKAKLLKDFDKMPQDIQFKVSQLIKSATDGPYDWIDYNAKGSFTHYQKIVTDSRRDPTFARFLLGKRMLDPSSGAGGFARMQREVDAFLANPGPREENLAKVVQMYKTRFTNSGEQGEYFKAWYMLGYRKGGGLRRVGVSTHRLIHYTDDADNFTVGKAGDVRIQDKPQTRYVNDDRKSSGGPALEVGDPKVKEQDAEAGRIPEKGVKGDSQGLVDGLYDWYEYWYTHPTLGKHWQPQHGWANTRRFEGTLAQGTIPQDLLFGRTYHGLFDGNEAKKAWQAIARMKPGDKQFKTWDGRTIELTPQDTCRWQPQLWGQRTFSGTNPTLLHNGRDLIYSILDYSGSKMNEMVYASAFAKNVDELTAEAQKLGKVGPAEIAKIEETAHWTARAYMERVMFTNVTYGGEEFLRNLVMFLPAYRQFAQYWVPYLATHPFALSVIARLNRDKEQLKVNRGGFEFNFGRMSFLINQSDTAESPIKNITGWLPSGGPLLTVPVSLGAHNARGEKGNVWGQLAGNWPFEFSGEFSALNSPFDKIVYGATGWTLPWPFGTDATKNAWRAIQIQNEALRNHDKRISGKEAMWKVRVNRLIEGGWNFVSPVGGRVVDEDIEAMMKGKLDYNKAKTPLEVQQILAKPEMKVFKTYLKWQNLPSYEQLDFMSKHPEIVPYAVSGYTAGSNPSGAVGMLYSTAKDAGVPDPETYIQRVDEKYDQLNKVLEAEAFRKEKDDEEAWWSEFKAANADLHELPRLQNEWETSSGAFAVGGNLYIQGRRGLAYYQEQLNSKYLGISDPYVGISSSTGDAYRLAKFMDTMGGASRALLQMSPNYEMYILQKSNEQQSAVTDMVKGYVDHRMSTRLTREQIVAAGYTLAEADDLYAATKSIDKLWNTATFAAEKYGGFTTSEGRQIRKTALEAQNALIGSNAVYQGFFGDNAAALFFGTYLTKPAYTRNDYLKLDDMDEVEAETFKHLMTEKDPETGKPRLSVPYLPRNAKDLRQGAQITGYVPPVDGGSWRAVVSMETGEGGSLVGSIPCKTPAGAKAVSLSYQQTHEILSSAFLDEETTLQDYMTLQKQIRAATLPKWAKDMIKEDLRAAAWQVWLARAASARRELRDSINEFYGDAPGFSLDSKFGQKWKSTIIGFAGFLGKLSPEFEAEWQTYNKENEMVNGILGWYL